jgi:hypothetical protein
VQSAARFISSSKTVLGTNVNGQTAKLIVGSSLKLEMIEMMSVQANIRVIGLLSHFRTKFRNNVRAAET